MPLDSAAGEAPPAALRHLILCHHPGIGTLPEPGLAPDGPCKRFCADGRDASARDVRGEAGRRLLSGLAHPLQTAPQLPHD